MRLLIAPILVLAACSGPKSGDPAAAPADNAASANVVAEATPVPSDNAVVSPVAPAKREADYVGRWIGVEGTYLNVASRPAGGVSMEMQYDLDNKGTYEGKVTPEGLSFTRNGVAEIARPSDGDATGLKWLAGKKDCLTVKSGEGYCRG